LWPKPIKFTPVAYIALPGLTDGPLKVISGATVLVVPTEEPEFRLLDGGCWLAELIERRIVADTRNQLNADVLRRVGCEVHGVCRSANAFPSRILHEPFLNSLRIGHHEIDVVCLLITVQQPLPVSDLGLLELDGSA
jgi:hypothetical protein